MGIRDELTVIIRQPQYSLSIWAVVCILLAGSALLCYSRSVILEIETNSNLIEASSRW